MQKKPQLSPSFYFKPQTTLFTLSPTFDVGIRGWAGREEKSKPTGQETKEVTHSFY